MVSWLTYIIPALLISQECHSARILALIPFPGKSHYINIQPIMQKLAEIGHDVTVVTSYAEKETLPNYHQIVVDRKTIWDYFGTKHDKFSFESMPFWKEIRHIWDAAYFTTEVAFNSTSLKNFIENDNSHFDLVIVELFFQEALYMFAHKYKAPIVAISTMGFTQYLGDFMGNPLQLSYMPHEFLSTRGRLNLWKRLENLYYTLYDLVGRSYFMLPRHEELLKRHFKNVPGPWPSLAELQRNVSVVLVNTHYSMDLVRPQVPGIVEIGGVHIKKEKRLSEDLQKFIDESPDGVVFFSLGSNLNSTEMPKNKVNMFLNAFAKLKQRILWKWEDEELPNKPPNVMIKSWLPQTDILAHRNVKLFITHGGLLSTIEAVHFGKPIIGIPVYGDQHLNTARAENMGFGIKLAFSSLTEEKISKALSEILNNPSYHSKAISLANRFRDRPLSAMDSAIYWIEYVIRHKGADFMKSPVLGLPWYESSMIDVVITIILITTTPIILALFIIKMLANLLFGAPKKDDKKSSGKKIDKKSESKKKK